MRIAFVVVVVAIASIVACAGVRIQKMARGSSGQPTSVVVSVDLCDLCSEPFDWQRSAATTEASQRCSGPIAPLEEGTTLSGSYEGFAGAAFARHSYYYAFRCGAGAAAATTIGGCEKDTDCKGDRVCDRGACASPSPTAAPATTRTTPAAPARAECTTDSDCHGQSLCEGGACVDSSG